MKKLAILTIALVLTITSYGQTWNLDKAHAKLGFTITHMMLSDVEGWFRNFDAKITASKGDFSDAIIELTADAASVNTESETRDAHIKSPDFFDVAKYPLITFKSKSFKKVDGKKYKLTGDLTMHGITRTVELDVVYNGTSTMPNSTKKVAGFKVSGTLKRSDFGVGNAPVAMLSDEITLIANAEFAQAQDNQ